MSAARLIELEAMMMNVGLRCARVGVPMADHLDDLSARHHTMFQSARGRLRGYMGDLVSAAGAAAAKAPIAKPASSFRAVATKAAPTATRGKAAKQGPQAAPVAAAKKAAKAAPLATAVKPHQAAPRTRHGDPLERYMTMLGNRYGAGSTTPGRCQSFDAIALSLGEPGSDSRLLTMVAESLIGTTLLETLTECAGKS